MGGSFQTLNQEVHFSVPELQVARPREPTVFKKKFFMLASAVAHGRPKCFVTTCCNRKNAFGFLVFASGAWESIFIWRFEWPLNEL